MGDGNSDENNDGIIQNSRGLFSLSLSLSLMKWMRKMVAEDPAGGVLDFGKRILVLNLLHFPGAVESIPSIYHINYSFINKN